MQASPPIRESSNYTVNKDLTLLHYARRKENTLRGRDGERERERGEKKAQKRVSEFEARAKQDR